MYHTNYEKGTKVSTLGHYRIASTLPRRVGVGGRAHSRADRRSSHSACRRTPIVLLATAFALLALSVGAAPASAVTGYPQLGQLFGPNPGARFGVLHSESVAADDVNGHIFVADSSDGLVYDFTSSTDLFPTVWNGSNTPKGSFGGGRVSIAVDNASGDVYVADYEHRVIDKFDENGDLVASFGDTKPTPDGQLAGVATPAGFFSPPTNVVLGITVDQATGDLYVLDAGDEVVDIFDSSGAYLRQIKLPISGDVVQYGDGIAVDDATGSVLLSDSGPDDIYEFNSSGSYVKTLNGSNTPAGRFGSYISVAADNSSGDIYVASSDGHLYRFDSSGNLLDEEVGVATGDAGHTPGVAVDQATGDVYVSEFAGAGGVVRILGPSAVSLPDVTTGAASNVISTTATLSGQLDPDGAGEVTDCHFEYGESEAYGEIAPCSPAAPYANPTAVTAELTGLHVDTTYHFRLSAANANGPNLGSDQTFQTGGPPTTSEESAADVTKFAATLQAEVNPHNFATTYHFQYVDEEHFKSGGFSNSATRETSESASIGDDDSSHPASGAIGALKLETTYHFRVVATSECEPGKKCVTDGEDATFTTLPALSIDSESAAGVTSTSATLDAQINPLGTETMYYFQYGTTEAYGSEVPASPGVSLGSGEGDVGVSVHLQSLTAGTTYHYRVVAGNALRSEVTGPDEAFTTQAAGTATAPPDGRQWEMVTPPNKQGAGLYGVGVSEGDDIQAAVGGGAITYGSTAPFEVDPAASRSPEMTQDLSRRTAPGSWATGDITTPHDEGPSKPLVGASAEYKLFSSDLSVGLTEPEGNTPLPPLPAGSEKTLYLREASGAYRALVSAENVPPGTKIGGPNEGSAEQQDSAVNFVGASPDLSNVLLKSEVALEEGAPANGGLYEWAGGRLRLVSVLPGGEGTAHAQLGYLGVRNGGDTQHAVSDDGSRVVWEVPGEGLFLRDVTRGTNGETVRVDAAQGVPQPAGDQPSYWTASGEGSRVFFTSPGRLTEGSTAPGQPGRDGDLYVFEVTSGPTEPLAGRLTDLTVDDHAGETAEVLGVIGASEDGSYVYFAAEGALGGATKGGANLYVEHYEAASRTWGPPTFIAAGGDGHSWARESLGGNLDGMTARVSPNGRYLAFMSAASLTGYENRDAVSGVRDQEVYLYDASSGRLVCASCDPTGARPLGVLEQGAFGPLWDERQLWRGVWVAASVPGWTTESVSAAPYQSRYLSNGGRLFFDSSDALVPGDVNGQVDVYEYEAPGEGSCQPPGYGASASVVYNPEAGGCVGLVSAGTSSEESAFLDASESGGDVFFLTTSQLSPADYDNSNDIYDAHECTQASPCAPLPLLKRPPCTTGDACKAAPTPQPELYGAPSSETFSGAGNVTPAAVLPAKSKVKRAKAKAKTTRCRKRSRGCKSRKRKATKSATARARRRG